jgi:hypothetical protein
MFTITSKFITPAFHEALDPTRVEAGIVAATLGFFAYSGLALLIGL